MSPNAAARLTARVLLPVPPFWLAIATTGVLDMGTCSDPLGGILQTGFLGEILHSLDPSTDACDRASRVFVGLGAG